MNADRLLALFERISEAPDAIPRLRRFILDLAVRGKLVEQDPQDEPVAEVLRRISIKRSLKGDFLIPSAWEWVAVGDVSESRLGKMLDKGKNKGVERPYLRNLNVRWFDFDLSDLLEMRFEDSELPEYALRRGDVLICEGGEPGRAAIWDERIEGVYFQKAIHRARFNTFVDPLYFVYALRASADDGRLSTYITGTGISHFTGRGLKSYRFPLPPLAEQHRIVAKVDELMALCDQLTAARMQREQCRERLVAASLQRLNQPSDDPEAFRSDARFALQVLPSLTSTPAQVKQLRQTILNLAVRGKLVEQDPEDEPAELLLQCLQQHSRKSGSPAFKGESLPFDLPVGWAPASLGDMVQASNSGWSPKTLDVPRQDEEWGILKVSAVSWERFQPNANKQVLPGTQPKPQAVVEKGDFLISRANTAELVARAVIVDCDPVNLMMSDKIVRLQFVELCEPRYILIVNNHANFARSYFANHATGVSPSMKNVSRDVILGLPLPLPPLAEQHRIVAKVDELMALCDQLEQQLSQAEQSRHGLLEAVLREALAGRLPDRPEERHAAL